MLKQVHVLMLDSCGREIDTVCILNSQSEVNNVIAKQREDSTYLSRLTGNDYYDDADPDMLFSELAYVVENINV